ncbi:MAG: hypothetical protein COY40_05890 [Alphaproteobacteria bacterium CG_4_10_14_0_8_um_filter_53_9]|nr:MAG: hypothetical protein COY40_05890 [Alphaproteobacteria bacterium CG_4_10_14_0_8_um_filter_53_9]
MGNYETDTHAPAGATTTGETARSPHADMAAKLLARRQKQRQEEALARLSEAHTKAKAREKSRAAPRKKAKQTRSESSVSDTDPIPPLLDAVVSFWVRQRQGATTEQALLFVTLGHFDSWVALPENKGASVEDFARALFAQLNAYDMHLPPLPRYQELTKRPWRGDGASLSGIEFLNSVIQAALAVLAEGRAFNSLRNLSAHLAQKQEVTTASSTSCLLALMYGTTFEEWVAIMARVMNRRQNVIAHAYTAMWKLVLIEHKKQPFPNFHAANEWVTAQIGGRLSSFFDSRSPLELVREVRKTFPDVLGERLKRLEAAAD